MGFVVRIRLGRARQGRGVGEPRARSLRLFAGRGGGLRGLGGRLGREGLGSGQVSEREAGERLDTGGELRLYL